MTNAPKDTPPASATETPASGGPSSITPDGPPGMEGEGKEAGAALPRSECGSFDIRIDRDGRWYYQNSPIGRMGLVKLFASVLSRDEDGVYWLTTPAERGTIEVEDAPFVAVEMTVAGAGADQVIALRTNLDDWVEVDRDHPVWLNTDAADGPTPYVHVRNGLNARIARPVYYDLVALAVEGKCEVEASPEKGTIGVWSKGQFFPLGSILDET